MVIATDVPLALAHAKLTQKYMRNDQRCSVGAAVLEDIKGSGSYWELGHRNLEVTPITAAVIINGSVLTIFQFDALNVDNLHPLRLSLSPKTKSPKENLGASKCKF
jgi:hypothetical protein